MCRYFSVCEAFIAFRDPAETRNAIVVAAHRPAVDNAGEGAQEGERLHEFRRAVSAPLRGQQALPAMASLWQSLRRGRTSPRLDNPFLGGTPGTWGHSRRQLLPNAAMAAFTVGQAKKKPRPDGRPGRGFATVMLSA